MKLLTLTVCSLLGVLIYELQPPKSLTRTRHLHQYIIVKEVHLISMVPSSPIISEVTSVLIHKGFIEKIAPFQELMLHIKQEPSLIIEGNGATLMPGLIDAHVHIWDEPELAAFLTYGVTSVRNMSGQNFHLNLIKKIENNQILSPDIITSSPILNSPGPNTQIDHYIVKNSEQARSAVKTFYKKGYSLLKVYSNLEKASYRAILEESSKLGLKITGHTPEGFREKGVPITKNFNIPFADSLDENFQSIEHIESIVWHGLRDRLDLSEAKALALKIAKSKTPVTTTLSAHANLLRVSESKNKYLRREGVETINPLIKYFESENYEYWKSKQPSQYIIDRARFYLKMTKILHEAGVTLTAGSDAGIFTNIPGDSLIQELKLIKQAGVSSIETLKMATLNAAKVLDLRNTGQITPGFVANLILLQGNPLNDLDTLKTPKGVIIRGLWLPQEELNKLKKTAKNTSITRSVKHSIAIILGFK